MFDQLKQQVQDNFKKLSEQPLFYVTIDRDVIWERYLMGFAEENRQSHNCNCCKSFLRQWSGIVAVIDRKKVSIWDNIITDSEYQNSVDRVRRYIQSLPITDTFLSELQKCGTDKNWDPKTSVTWTHFYLQLPSQYVNSRNIATILGEKRDNKTVLKRSLDELTIDATETVLDLIAQGSLYKGPEYAGVLQEFLKIQKEYTLVPSELKDNYVWLKSVQISQGLSRIRNTAIGTLLINLSENMPLDTAVNKFEQVVAPSNYKRPSALVTPKMVEQAKEKLVELGLLESLERRLANDTDLNVENILFTDKSTSVSDVFGEMAKGTIVNPKSFSKIEEVSIEDFINKIVPGSKSIEVLPENGHLNNFVSLLTAVHKDSPSLFRWNNNFSWAYIGGITDALKERVKQAGGNVEGVLRFSIQWNEDGKSICDLDAHAYEPQGRYIAFNTYKGRKTEMSGMLDVDMINPPKTGVENITWTNKSLMNEGVYKFEIHNYNQRRNNGFKAQVEMDGQIFDFSHGTHLSGTMEVAQIRYSRVNGFEIVKSLDTSSGTIQSKDKWNIKTSQFHKVKKLMLSPNHWEQKTGNKHYMFFIEDCISDEEPRPFFNEFLKEEFTENRKVFEIMGSKLKVPKTNNQLSGLGFSETQRNYLIVRVDGKFKRVIKINF